MAEVRLDLSFQAYKYIRHNQSAVYIIAINSRHTRSIVHHVQIHTIQNSHHRSDDIQRTVRSLEAPGWYLPRRYVWDR